MVVATEAAGAEGGKGCWAPPEVGCGGELACPAGGVGCEVGGGESGCEDGDVCGGIQGWGGVQVGLALASGEGEAAARFLMRS